ncbi:MAG: hexitol phosphatase HxpB, partial [Acidobacteriota bacterium]
DIDGVLVDSEPFWQRAEVEVFGAAGIELAREDCRRTMGMRLDAVIDYWLRRRPWDLEAWPRERVATDILERVCELIRLEGERLPGVGTAIGFLGERGQRLALATSSPEVVIDAVLDTLSLSTEFEATVSAENERRGKPDPDVYLTAARRLGVEPGECLAVEDSLAGLEAALAAGMRCVMVPDPSLVAEPRLRDADLVLESLSALPDHWQELAKA